LTTLFTVVQYCYCVIVIIIISIIADSYRAPIAQNKNECELCYENKLCIVKREMISEKKSYRMESDPLCSTTDCSFSISRFLYINTQNDT